MIGSLIIRFKKVLILLVGLAFFFIYSYLNFGNTNERYSWPDEMSNYAFIQNFAQQGNFNIAEPKNIMADDLIFPRSFKVINHNLAPVGFLGLPLVYGIFAAFVPDWWTNFLTPLLAVIGAYFFYRLNSEIFDEETGLLSGFLLLTMPAFAYYASFSMLPNVPMLSLLIIGAYFLNKSLTKKNQYKYFIASGFFIGLGLIFRPVEVLWVAPILLGLLIAYWKKVKFRFWLSGIAPMALLTGLYLYFNYQTYGSVFKTGYFTGGASNILPFGFSLSAIVHNLLVYVISVQWYFLSLLVIGFIVFGLYHSNRSKRIYLAVYSLVSLFLILYYCSWQLSDQMTLEISRLGVSFNRYLLPIFIGGIPLVASLLLQIYRSKENFSKTLAIIMFLVSCFLFIDVTYFQGNDNLRNIKKSISEYNILHDKILNLVPENGVIITERGDKIVYPERSVITQFDEKNISGISAIIKNGYPVYHLVFKEPDISPKLKISNKKDLDFGYSLYEVATK